jgi:PAS domain S-box-containing protein
MVWRWLAVATTLLVVGHASSSWAWAGGVALALVAGAGAFHFFEREVLERWAARGYLVVADALLIGLALLGTGDLPPGALVGYCGVLLLALVVADRLRALLGGAALVALLYAAAAAGVLPGLELSPGAAIHLPLLLACAVHFGRLAEYLPGHQQAAAERARRETDGLRVLFEIADTIGRTLDVGRVMRSIVERMGDLMGTESCSILLAEAQGRQGFVVASKGHPDVDMLELDLAGYPEIRQALEAREPVHVEDVATHPLLAPVKDALIAKGYRTLLVVPLLFGDEVLGVLSVRFRETRPFSPAELRLCKVVAGTSANALKNALLFRDVQREAAEHQATGEKLRRVLDCTPDLIVAVDVEGRVTQFNRGAEILTGRATAEALGRRLPEILGPQVGTAGGGDAGREPRDVSLHRADGERLEISLASAPLTGPDGERAGRVWVGRDVTKLRRVEKSLAQAERLSSLGEVVAGVAHELNNPLTGVVGYAELLRLKAQRADEIQDLERIVESAGRCQRIVHKLLSFARKHPPEMKYQSLNDCVAKVIDLKSYHLRTSRITVVLELDPGLPDTCFDFHQIEQVVLNLLNNAEQAIASIRRPGRIVLRTSVRGEWVLLEVEDDGPGVPAAARDRIFDPFFTTKPIGMGTGLGLSVSYGIVNEHGGRIELDPEAAAGGARFTVWLPLVPERSSAAQPSATPVERRERALGGLRILLADDDAIVLDLLAAMLSAEGAEVTPTRDGCEAWERLQGQDYDLIVADLRMPNVDGQQLYERVACERPELVRRFVFATGDLARQETLAFLEGLPNRILAKPFEVETVRRVLSQAAARGEA